MDASNDDLHPLWVGGKKISRIKMESGDFVMFHDKNILKLNNGTMEQGFIYITTYIMMLKPSSNIIEISLGVFSFLFILYALVSWHQLSLPTRFYPNNYILVYRFPKPLLIWQ